MTPYSDVSEHRTAPNFRPRHESSPWKSQLKL